jgi:ribosomal protein S18 acetylase RimI-like enzyme
MLRFKIQRAQMQDIKPMLELWATTPGIQIGLGDDEDSIKAFLELDSTICLIIKAGDLLAGTVAATFDGRRGFIYHLAVRPEYQKQGIGKMLLDRIVVELQKRNAKKINLFVRKDNLSAMEFYSHQGWERRRDIQVYSLTVDNTN